MINTFESVKVLKVDKVTDLSTNFAPASGKPFHIFINPKSESSYDIGDVVVITAKPAKNNTATAVPVVIGDWNPVLFENITAGAFDITTNDIYYSEVDTY